MPFKPFATRAKKVVYVIAVGGDAPTREKFVSVLTSRLQKLKAYSTASIILVPEPDWAPNDYISTCQGEYDYTAGALIVSIGAIANYGHSFFIARTTKTNIMASLLISDCKAPVGSSPSPSPSPTKRPPVTSTSSPLDFGAKLSVASGTIIQNLQPPYKGTRITDFTKLSPQKDPNYFLRWQTNVEEWTGKSTFWTPFPAIGFLLSAASIWATVSPSHTKSTVTTTIFATPIPGQPFPQNGAITQTAVTEATATNVSQLQTVAGAWLTQSLTYTSNLEQTPTIDRQTLDAIDNIVTIFLSKYLGCTAISNLIFNPESADATSNAPTTDC